MMLNSEGNGLRRSIGLLREYRVMRNERSGAVDVIASSNVEVSEADDLSDATQAENSTTKPWAEETTNPAVAAPKSPQTAP